MKTIKSILVLLFALAIHVYSQQWTRYNSYTSGLSHNTVYDIDIEKNGTKWFATYYGVSKLSGTTWKKYNTTNGLAGNRVFCVVIDKNGVKWFGTDNGLSKYNDTTFTNYTTSNGLINNEILDIAIDNQGKKWLATSGGLSVFNDTIFKNYTTTDGLPVNSLQCITIDTLNNKWIGCNYGISRFDGHAFHNINPSAGTFYGNSVNSIVTDPNNIIWIGTETGTAQFNGATWKNYTYKPGELCDNMVNKIAIDSIGQVWFATNNGISGFDGAHWFNYTTADGLTDNMVYSIAFEGKNTCWFGLGINGVNKMAAPTLSVSAFLLGIGGEQNSKTYFNINSNAMWNISSNENWLSFNKASGSGNASITVTASENPSTFMIRQATITISVTGLPPRTIDVSQATANPRLEVSPKTIDLPGLENSEAFITIITNSGWKVISDSSWITISQDFGLGSSTIMLRAKGNTTGKSRKANIRINSFGLPTDTVTILQAAQEPVLFASPSVINISNAANSKGEIKISSNLSWTASSNQGWLTVEPLSGSNSASVQVIAQENTSTSSRMATVTFSGSGVSDKTVTVIQEPKPYVNLPAKKIYINAAENSITTFIVESNSKYELSWSALWFRLNRSNGDGTDTVTVTAEKNFLSSARTGYIYVEQGGKKDTITLIQAEGPYIEVSANTINIDSAGTNNTKLYIVSNTTWKLQTAFALVTPDKTSGNGTDTVTLSAPRNSGNAALADYLTISDTTGIFKTVEIVQACTAPYIYADTSDLYLAKEQNSNATFTISSNRPWTVTVDYIFFHLSQESGTGNATITVTADKNLINSPAQGTITIYSEGKPVYTIQVTQESANLYMMVKQKSFNLDVNGVQKAMIEIISNIDWGISNNNTWLTFNKTEGTHNDTLRATASVNYEMNRRSGTLLLYSSYYGVDNISIDISQDSMYLYFWTDSIVLSAADKSSESFNIFCNSNWYTYNYSSWLTISALSGNSDSMITCTALENTEETPRSEILTFYAGALTKTMKIVQLGKTITQSKEFKGEYRIYPNPAQDILHIKYPAQNIYISITDSKGIPVLTRKISGNVHSIFIGHLPGGIYQITINDGKTATNRKFIKIN